MASKGKRPVEDGVKERFYTEVRAVRKPPKRPLLGLHFARRRARYH